MIRPAQEKHLQAINDIYNQAVKDGLRTAHTEPFSLENRKAWFAEYSQEVYPIYVYTEQEKVLGWISVSPYRSDRQALNEVVEVSYYVDYDHHNQSFATKLMEQAIRFCTQSHYRIIVAILVSGNEPSLALLKKFDFQEAGRIPNAIRYGKQFRDHLYMYKTIN